MSRKILVGLAVAGLVIFGWSQMSNAVTFSNTDFSGTWNFYADWQQDNAVDNGWWHGPITSNGDGTIAAGPGDELTRQDGTTDTVLSTSTYELNTDGAMTATLNFESGVVVEVNAAMNSSKDVISFVGTETYSDSTVCYGRGTAAKNQSGDFTNADFSGTWSFYGSWQDENASDNLWVYGTMTSDGSGNVTGGTLTASGFGLSTDIPAGTYAINSDGTITVDVWEEFHAAMNDSKDVVGAVMTEGGYWAGVFIKNQADDFTDADLSGASYMYESWQVGDFWGVEDSVDNGWIWRSVVSDGVGAITANTEYKQDGSSEEMGNPTYTINTDGTMTMTGLTGITWYGAMNDSKDVIGYVGTSLSDEGQDVYYAGVWVIPKYTEKEEETTEEETTTTTSGGGDDRCFIATVAYGTPMAKEVKTLGKFRDDVLLKTPAGRQFVKFYYATSPPIADFIRNRPGLKSIVREALKPLVEVSKEITK